MTIAPATTPSTATPEAQPTDLAPSPRRTVVRVLVSLAALAVAAVALTWSGSSAEVKAAYHPQNPTANGSQALARVLASHGITVDIVTGEAALVEAKVDGTTTLVVTDTSQLRDATIASLDQAARNAGRVVLVNPGVRVLRTLAPDVGQRSFSANGSLVAACDADDIRRGESISRAQSAYRAFGTARAGDTCFMDNLYAVYLQVENNATRRPSTILIGSTDLIVNSRITNADNAGIAVRAMGHLPRVVWYVPDLRDAPVTSGGADRQLAPPWLSPMLVLAAFAFGGVMLWRGRRLGRLVREPLPVVVRAIETTESRGRLYRKARDGARASSVLREATMRRLTAYLGLPPASRPDAVIAAVAAASPRTPETVAWLLTGPPASSESEMLTLAADLAALEKEIRRS